MAGKNGIVVPNNINNHHDIPNISPLNHQEITMTIPINQ
jgi:hypothetical protein